MHIVGLTAGASAPEGLVERVIHYLRKIGYPEVETIGCIREDVEFALPAELVAWRPRVDGADVSGTASSASQEQQ